MIYTGIMSGIIQFTIKKDEDGVYCAKAVDHPIFTFGKTLPELENNIREAAALYIEDAPEQRLPWSWARTPLVQLDLQYVSTLGGLHLKYTYGIISL